MKVFIIIGLLFSSFALVNAQEPAKEPANSPKKAEPFKKRLEDAKKPKEAAAGQFDLNFETVDNGCGKSSTESQVYGYRYGKVFEITSDNKIIVKVTRSNNVWDDEYEKSDGGGVGRKLKKVQLIIVSLVGIDESVGQAEIQKFLLERLINQEVTLIGNTRKDDAKKIDALIQLDDSDEIDELSEYLLENGIARFKEFQLTNIVPARTACELKRAEEKAKEAKLGIWAQ